MGAKLFAIPYGHGDGTTAALPSRQRELMLPVQHGLFTIVLGQEGCVEGSFFSHCLFTLERGQKEYLEGAVLSQSLWSDFLFLVCCERYVCKCLGWHEE